MRTRDRPCAWISRRQSVAESRSLGGSAVFFSRAGKLSLGTTNAGFTTATSAFRRDSFSGRYSGPLATAKGPYSFTEFRVSAPALAGHAWNRYYRMDQFAAPAADGRAQYSCWSNVQRPVGGCSRSSRPCHGFRRERASASAFTRSSDGAVVGSSRADAAAVVSAVSPQPQRGKEALAPPCRLRAAVPQETD